MCSVPADSSLTAFDETSLVNASMGFQGCNDYAGWADILGRLGAQVRKLARSWANFSLLQLYARRNTGTHGPTWIFWANLTPFSLQYPALAAVNVDDFTANLIRHGPGLNPFTEELVTLMVGRLHAGNVQFIPTHYHSAKGQSAFVLDAFPWLAPVLDGALFYYMGDCDAGALPDFASQIRQFDAALAAASKQLHVGLYFSHMGGCDNNGTTSPGR
jgi:hypothetical protein